MGLDLFVVVEKLFQGTILFAFKFVSTLAQIIVSPTANSRRAYFRFQSKSTREIGPATFLAACAAISLSTFSVLLVALLLPNQEGLLGSELQALDTSALRSPLLRILVGVLAIVSVVELQYRVINFFAFRNDGASDEEDLASTTRAVGFYTSGVGVLIVPFTLCITAACDFLFDIDWPTVFLSLAFYLWPALPAGAATKAIRPAHPIPVFCLLFVLTVCSFVGAGALSLWSFGLLDQQSNPLISDLDCHEEGANIITLVEIRNESPHAAIFNAQADQWRLEIHEPRASTLTLFSFPAAYARINPFQVSAATVSSKPETNEGDIVIKPNDVADVIIKFPLPADEINIEGLVACRVRQKSKSLSYEKNVILQSEADFPPFVARKR